MRGRWCVPWVLVGLTASAAWGARPFITDDARITEKGACQVETWGQIGPGNDQFWLLPACDPFGHVELTAGFAMLPDADHDTPQHPAVLLQGKALLRALHPNDFGVALAVGSLIDARPLTAEDQQLGSLYGYVPVSFSILDDRLVVHINVGFRYEDDDKDARATWGVAGELEILPRLYGMLETYGSSDETPFMQVGARIWLVPSHLQVDTAYGTQLQAGNNDWVTIGLRFISPPFL